MSKTVDPIKFTEELLTEEYMYNLGLRPCRRLIGEGDEMRDETDEEFRERLLEMCA